MQRSAANTFLTATGFALFFVALFHLSGLISGNQAFGGVASIFFLPAFVRLLGFLVIGYWIVPALFVAGLYLNYTGAFDLGPGADAAEVIISACGAVGGPLGAFITSRMCRLEQGLSNLTPLRLLALSLGCSAGNAIFHHFGYQFVEVTSPLVVSSLYVFVGDTTGTWAIIYLIKAALTLSGRRLRS